MHVSKYTIERVVCNIVYYTGGMHSVVVRDQCEFVSKSGIVTLLSVLLLGVQARNVCKHGFTCTFIGF